MKNEKSALQRAVAIALPVLVLGAGVAAYLFVKNNPPEAQKRPPAPARVVQVEARELSAQNYNVKLRSYGSVQPRKQTVLIAQVSGVVAQVSPKFRVGARFAQGDVLLQLESRDYEIAVASAQASLVQAEAVLIEEEARGQAAVRDWNRLGKKGAPSALTSREPQRKSAQSKVLSAQVGLERAELDLARTQIRAPYDGRVIQASVDEGRFVSPGTSLGEVYADGALDVRLPLSAAQLLQMDRDTLNDGVATIELYSDARGDGRPHHAVLARSEGQLDVNTRQMFVVAELAADERLTIGEFVEAHISGRLYREVFVVPERLLQPGGYVLLASDGQVVRKPVELLYNDGDNAVVRGLVNGDRLIVTPLGNAASGMRVKVASDGDKLSESAVGDAGTKP